MMERTHVLMRRHFGGIGTDGGQYYSKERRHKERRHSLRSDNESYGRGASDSIEHRFIQVETEPYLLGQRPERENTTHYNKNITIGLQERKIKHLMRVIMSLERKVEYFEEKIDFMKDEIIYINERSRNELQEKNEYESDLRDQLKQTENTLYEIKAERDEMIMTKSTENLYQESQIYKRDLEIKALRELLNCQTTGKNEEYVKLRLQEKYNKVSVDKEQMKQPLKTWQEKETGFSKHINSLENKLEIRNHQLRELEKMKESKTIEINDCKEHRKNPVKKKDDQLHQTSTKLQETEDKLNQTISLLKEKNQHLQGEAENRNREAKRLEEMLNSKTIAIYESDARQVNTVIKKKDDTISDLKDKLKQTLKTMDEKEREMNGILSSLKIKAQNLQKEIERRDSQMKDQELMLEHKNKEISDRNKILEKQLKEKDCELEGQREQQQQILKSTQTKEAEMEESIALLKKKVKHLNAEVEHRNSRVKHLEETLSSKTNETPAREDTDNYVMKMEDKITELTEQLDKTLTKLDETKSELDETKTRLSKAMGNMLTDNNPNIADLSDKNRPTKLSERFAELYDNQWTDAFDILDKHFHTEETTITALLQILKDAMSFCKNMGHEQMEDLRRVLTFASKHDDGSMSRDMNKLLKDCRKAMATVAICNLYEMYMSHIRQSKDETIKAALTVSSFTKECLEVCWFMVVQDPAVEFAPVLSKGSRFNTDLFKPYTKSGTHVDYVVWPALLLHETGPVLTKGVAQGYGKKSS